MLQIIKYEAIWHMRPRAREESASPAWLAAPAMNARDTTKGNIRRISVTIKSLKWC